jgi:hypothetical protein
VVQKFQSSENSPLRRQQPPANHLRLQDFLCLDLERPKPMSVAQFLEFEGVEL